MMMGAVKLCVLPRCSTHRRWIYSVKNPRQAHGKLALALPGG
jgi:hypothetical protein